MCRIPGKDGKRRPSSSQLRSIDIKSSDPGSLSKPVLRMSNFRKEHPWRHAISFIHWPCIYRQLSWHTCALLLSVIRWLSIFGTLAAFVVTSRLCPIIPKKEIALHQVWWFAYGERDRRNMSGPRGSLTASSLKTLWNFLIQNKDGIYKRCDCFLGTAPIVGHPQGSVPLSFSIHPLLTHISGNATFVHGVRLRIKPSATSAHTQLAAACPRRRPCYM